uniref:SphG n=1 Tax=Herpetosiphon sp. B060 TaxID=2002978 RepID=A0A2Z2H0B0_9CHLR|nr:SphG [Herpetosiphon sp. B060]
MVPETIVYLWSEQASANQPASASLDLTLYPLFLLSQAFIHHKRAAMRVLYCYSDAPQPIAPFIMGLAGFARSLQMEHQQYWIQLLALQSSDVAMNRQVLAAIIRDELADTTSREFELRYQEGKKFARRFLPHAAPTPTADPQQLVLRPHGCYVIAGGKGALGAIFARYFASQAKVQLVLLGRSPIDQPTQKLISELEQTGSQAHYLQVDISDQAALSLALAPFGTIHGIIQAAGISNDSLLVHKTKASIDQTIAAKVQGTLALDAITAKQPLDFFILFGSSSGAFGNLGQADYAYANSFLNGFAAYREYLATKALRHGKTIAINWPLWADGGMGHNQATQQRLAQLGLSPLATEQGLRAFELSLHTNQLQMIVLGGDRQRIANLVNPMPTPQPIQPNLVVDTPSMSETPITPTTTEPTMAETPSIDAALQHYTRDYLRALLADATKLSAQRINPNEPFESYGVDSVMILGLNNQLGDRFGELPKTLFFEYQTLEQLTGYFVENHRTTLLKDVRLPEPASVVAAKPTPQPTSVNPNPPSAPELSQLAPAQPATPKGEVDIAIIGVSGRYPLAANLDEFWQNLQTGRNCVTTIPAERWDYRRYFHPEKGTYGKTYSIWGGFLDDIDKFDPLFFNISPLEAEMLDPQERIFIQTVWHTLEDAGYTRNALSRYQVGVYVGVMWGQYQLYGAAEPDDGVILTPASSYASIANRVSYFFNFRGPSIALDTMCSSSLTTIHLACESIKRGEIEVALAGGVNLTLHPNKHIFLSQTKFASSEGLCRSFGDGGDGYVPSEGVGAILLKALPQAIQDGDRIYGVIKASAVNHGGKTNGYTVPNPRQQEDLIRQAFRKAQIDPQTISYIEAHGTGTALGDPIEITGLTKAFNLPANQRHVVAVGSVKSNIGHCESAAGIAGITKVLLQMQHGQLVPSIHAETLSSNINFAESPFYIQRNLSAWNSAGLRRAGVSSFGAGGANGHIVLEEYQTEIQPEPNDQRPQLIVLSARDNERLRANAAALEAYLVKQTGSNQATNRAFAGTNLQHELAELVANTLNVASSELDPGEPLHEYGLDAPAIFQLQKQFEQAYQLTLPSNNPIDAFSIDQLAEYLQAEYPQRFTHAHSAFQAPNLAPPQLRLADIAYTLQVGREAMEARVAFVVSSIEVLIERLHAFAGGATAIANCYLSATPKPSGD